MRTFGVLFPLLGYGCDRDGERDWCRAPNCGGYMSSVKAPVGAWASSPKDMVASLGVDSWDRSPMLWCAGWVFCDGSSRFSDVLRSS